MMKLADNKPDARAPLQSAYTVEWGDETQTLVVVQFEPPLTWEQIRHAYDDLYALMRSVPHQVDWISDISRAPMLPRGDVIRHLRLLLARIPDNAGINVVVGPDSFTATVLEIFVKAVMWGRGFAVVLSLEEAKQLIARHHAENPKR